MECSWSIDTPRHLGRINEVRLPVILQSIVQAPKIRLHDAKPPALNPSWVRETADKLEASVQTFPFSRIYFLVPSMPDNKLNVASSSLPIFLPKPKNPPDALATFSPKS